MSWMPGANPDLDPNCPDALEMVIVPRTGDIGNFEVFRALPFRKKRMVGPFIFWDQMGPGEFLTGQGVDVRPHPHIGLSTVTYLFDGSLHHRDSLGTDQTIHPGAINLMTAGKGIVHSERTGVEVRQGPSRLFGIQSWLAQPKPREDSRPTFHHQSKEELPSHQEKGLKFRVLMGEAYGIKSPIPTDWDTLYLDVQMKSGARIQIPTETEERAIYVLDGKTRVAGREFEPRQMLVLRPGREVVVEAVEATRLMVLGGAAMDGPRYIWWNFVSSDKERLEQAKADWKEGRFPSVPGDENDFIPLPEI
jgi:redox-sensitive bicupin YhaK (pirin superfamily)